MFYIMFIFQLLGCQAKGSCLCSCW